MEDTVEVKLQQAAPMASPVVNRPEAQTADDAPRHRFVLAPFLQDLRSGLPLLLADMVGLATATALSMVLLSILGVNPYGRFEGRLLALGGATVILYFLLGLYPGIGLNPIVELKNMILGIFSATVVLLFALFAYGEPPAPALISAVICAGVFACFAVPTARALARQYLGKMEWWAQPVMIIGAGPSAHLLRDTLQKRASMGFRPIGMLEEQYLCFGESNEIAADYLGPLSEVRTVAERFGAYRAMIAMADRPEESLDEVMDQCASLPHVILVPSFAAMPSLWSQAHDHGGFVGMHVRDRLLSRRAQLVKRTFELLAIAASSVVVVPLGLVIMALIYLFSPGPFFYGHSRIGRNGRRFKVWKFRSMVVNADAKLKDHLDANPAAREEWEATQKLQNDPRVIPIIGTFLRKTSLDELPQLLNVLWNDMSLVGPRPIVTSEVEKYGNVFNLYLRVQPGLTGLWQVSGRNLTSYEERVKLDAYYIRNWSLWLDLFILGRTIKTVIFREGAF